MTETIRVAKSVPYYLRRRAKTPEELAALQQNFTRTLDGAAKEGFLREREILAHSAKVAELRQRHAETLAALEEVDRKAARSLRALMLDGRDAKARDKLTALESGAQPLRDELAALEKQIEETEKEALDETEEEGENAP